LRIHPISRRTAPGRLVFIVEIPEGPPAIGPAIRHRSPTSDGVACAPATPIRYSHPGTHVAFPTLRLYGYSGAFAGSSWSFRRSWAIVRCCIRPRRA